MGIFSGSERDFFQVYFRYFTKDLRTNNFFLIFKVKFAQFLYIYIY